MTQVLSALLVGLMILGAAFLKLARDRRLDSTVVSAGWRRLLPPVSEYDAVGHRYLRFARASFLTAGIAGMLWVLLSAA